MMTPWFVRPNPRPSARVRLVCFPYAGVGASAFRGWSNALGPAIEVACVQPPGRESRLREKPLTSIFELARAIAAAMEGSIDRPYAFFGHSFGAVVAFETARCLRQRGLALPVRLFVSASRAPHLPWPHPPVRDLPDTEFLREIDRRYGGTVPAQVMDSLELRELFVPGLRADLAALETYVHEPRAPLSCGITAFAGTADTTVPISAVDSWRAQTTGEFSLDTMTGGHLFLRSAHAELVAALLRELRADGPPDSCAAPAWGCSGQAG